MNRAPMPSTPDVHNMPGPTLDDRIQVFEGRHLVGSLLALAIVAGPLLAWLAHWAFKP